MAAKREISSTLRNLKFMQRGAAAQKVEEKAKVEVQEEVAAAAPSGGFGSSAQVARKCIVIMEGNPHPGAVKGRMSFQNFNPSIDVSLEGFLLYISLWLFCPCRFVFPYKSLDI